MTRKQYIESFGEDPVDMFGSDWHNVLNDIVEPAYSQNHDPEDAEDQIFRELHFKDQLSRSDEE